MRSSDNVVVGRTLDWMHGELNGQDPSVWIEQKARRGASLSMTYKSTCCFCAECDSTPYVSVVKVLCESSVASQVSVVN